jgi:hypothetical protein
MDKIFSARLDESVIQQIGNLSRQLKVSKKRVLEEAVENYAEKIGGESGADVFEQTFGAWKRPETADKTARKTRAAFERSMKRRHS